MWDGLTDVLKDVRLERSFYARSDLTAPWGIAFSAKDGPSFHVILAGRCWLRTDTQNILLQAGDLVVLPHGDNHQLADSLESAAVPLMALPSERVGQNAAILHFGGEGERTRLICGGVWFAGPIVHPLFTLLPPVLLLHTESDGENGGAQPWVATTLAMLSTEALSPRAGSPALMTRIADILVLQTIRAWIERDAARRGGFLGPITDPEIGHVLAIIHRRATERWTVASLAHEAHLSRSVFSDRFSRQVGMAPMHYVTRWRMYLASIWIREDHMRVSEVADRLGYSSDAAFHRAFTRHVHVPPGAFKTNP